MSPRLITAVTSFSSRMVLNGWVSGQDCDGAQSQAPMRSLLALPKALRVPPRIGSTDQAEGMMPVSKRVRPEPRWPGIHHRSLRSLNWQWVCR